MAKHLISSSPKTLWVIQATKAAANKMRTSAVNVNFNNKTNQHRLILLQSCENFIEIFIVNILTQ